MNMKKIFLMISFTVLLIGLSACGKEYPEPEYVEKEASEMSLEESEEKETAPAVIHDHNFITVECKAPGCTEDGYILGKCSCGEEKITKELPATKHDYKVTEIAASCYHGAGEEYTCAKCGDSYLEEKTAPLEHDYVKLEIPASCEEMGCTRYTCSHCGDSYEEGHTPALGHTIVESVVSPTTSSKGYTLHRCSVCGYEYKDNYTEPVPFDIAQAEAVGNSYLQTLGYTINYSLNEGNAGYTYPSDFQPTAQTDQTWLNARVCEFADYTYTLNHYTYADLFENPDFEGLCARCSIRPCVNALGVTLYYIYIFYSWNGYEDII